MMRALPITSLAARLLWAAILLPALAGAQAPAQPQPATLQPLPALQAEGHGLPEAKSEPQVLHQVAEDDHVRIEELRVRGLSTKITVQPKIPGMPAYEIVPPSPGKAPGQDPKAGQRVWLSLPLSF
jgi:hypothetical protein